MTVSTDRHRRSVGYAFAKLVTWDLPSRSALLVLYLLVAMSGVGFLDDFIKVRKQRSLGLRSTAKLLGQTVVSLSFGFLALQPALRDGAAAVSHRLSLVRDFGPTLPWVIVMALIWFMVNGTRKRHEPRRRARRDAHRIIMGDTGSLALGAAMAGFAVLTRTELLLVVLGGLYVAVTGSVIIQVSWFKLTRRATGVGRRAFRMAPLQHHFELLGWEQVTVVIRFWIIAGVCVAAGLGIFYSDWVGNLT